MLEISGDSKGDKNDAEDDSGAEIELDKRTDEMKAEEKD
jgi:hypothetical protein